MTAASKNNPQSTLKNSSQLFEGGAKKVSNEPLFGFVPRRVTAKQVQGALVRKNPPDAVKKC